MNTALPGIEPKVYPYLGYCLTETTDVPGKGMFFFQNFRSSGYGYGRVAGLTEVPGNISRAYRTHRRSGQD